MKKIVMITGATAGFGWATAKIFAENGFDIIITGRRKERLAQLEKELVHSGARILPLNFDVRKRKEVESFINNLPGEWKNIDILVNNAGLASGYSHVDDGDPDDWDKMIDTNVKGLLYITRAVAPLMVSRGSGHIINISSIAGTDIYEYGNVYCASKSAVNTLSRAMRIDLVKHNIKVTNVAPGMAETEFSIVRFKGNEEKANAVYKGMDAMTAKDIAEVIFYCATLPPHFCINNVEISPTRQASVMNVNRKK
jgi:NADP-dependent 3-hydroxy acid dehydrogenase YdfG